MENVDLQQRPPKSSELSQKLTDWKNEPTLLTLKNDLQWAKPYHDQQASKIDHWNDLLHTRGKAAPPKIKGRSSVQPKLVRRQAEWRYSALTEPFLGTSKLFKVSPNTYADVDAARQNELVLNWQFRTKINRVRFIDDYIRSVVDDGTAIVRVNWKRITRKVRKDVPVWSHYPIQDPQQMQILQQAIQLKQENPRQYDNTVSDDVKAAVDFFEESQQPTLAVQTGTQKQTSEEVVENHPWVTVCNPKNIFIDPSCGSEFEKALFIIESFETNRGELEKSSIKYQNLDKVNWDGNTPLTDPYHVSPSKDLNFHFEDKARKKIVAYDYWGFFDISDEDDLVPFVATWIGDTLIRMELNPFPDQGLPYAVVPYSPIKRELYGEPDAELLGDNQAILGAVSRGLIDLMGRSANAQQGFAKGMLDPFNRRRFENGQDYEFNPNVNPTQGLIQHKFPEIPASAMQMLGLQNEEAEALTGVKSFSGGISGEAYGNLATAARGAMDAASKRESAILRRLAQGMVSVGMKIMAMNREFLSETETVKVTNEQFIQINREDLKGNFDLEVDIATAEQDQAQAQDLGFMLQTMGPNMAPDMMRMILAKIADLKRVPDLAHTLRNYQPPPPDPAAVQQQQLTLQKLQAEVERLQSEVELNKARAGDVAAAGNKKSVEAVEQETGVAHARNMEIQQAQARGNQDLEVTKALLKPKKPEESQPNIDAAVGFNHLSTVIAHHSNMSPAIPPPQ